VPERREGVGDRTGTVTGLERATTFPFRVREIEAVGQG
jgi:hypothetical protein